MRKDCRPVIRELMANKLSIIRRTTVLICCRFIIDTRWGFCHFKSDNNDTLSLKFVVNFICVCWVSSTSFWYFEHARFKTISKALRRQAACKTSLSNDTLKFDAKIWHAWKLSFSSDVKCCQWPCRTMARIS